MNVLISWIAHILPVFAANHLADTVTTYITGKKIFNKGTKWERIIDWGPPTIERLVIQPKDPIYGDILWIYKEAWNTPYMYLNVWVTLGDVQTTPMPGAELLAEVVVEPGQDYRLWYQFRATPWPPKPK
jgi:hypothetical protein